MNQITRTITLHLPDGAIIPIEKANELKRKLVRFLRKEYKIKAECFFKLEEQRKK
jgi:hypothetical protein